MGFVLAAAATIPKSSSITIGSHVTTLRHKIGKFQKENCVMISSNPNLKNLCTVSRRGFTYQEYKRNYVVHAASDQSFEYEHQAQDLKSNSSSLKDALSILYHFSRPYAAFGLAMMSTSMSLLAVEKLSDLSLTFFTGWLQIMVATICKHIFNGGLNQLSDVEIDKINKPYLPLPSGKLSYTNGVFIVASSLILGLWFAWMIGSWPLFWTLSGSYVFSAAYSVDVPFLRWKKSPLLTAMNYVLDMAIIMPLGYFLHMQTHVLKRPTTFPRQLIFCTTIISIFAIVIALFKDIPDMEGDGKFGIRSLSLRLGQKRVFWICISLLQMVYGGTILAGLTSTFLWSRISISMGHAILASVLWYRAKSVDLTNNDAIQSFYMFIWKLLSAECFLMPLFR
ncbi:PREDICTED: naringenin 8-dimethylallyltransferase 2, chloroplastic-like [Lupinus angustifolius]|uniref:naringenin 8-dimethylallyltransferase 2, chloroplastic-like n=1 Tax=Lupinus angustifolius TaxID=3871 RepID=UPI00092EAB29|nr:PREDICTED: naringenin 8-dimethylallyltransferase 2, chloroplastic-like [Lupinus angustifolius]